MISCTGGGGGTQQGLRSNRGGGAGDRRVDEVPYCLGTASGYGVLHSVLMGLEISGGGEVFTTPFT